ncbi:MAG: ATP-dependent metallopeptidase FtsH/Yme1/Tma family protein [Candidatus Lambdaproteobacteria bacterium]|nr:ATP-dependent metallopeptidase FtsH/Yme1/Tma family protein [Candidatus Lambdaproteobacteria bacterium]
MASRGTRAGRHDPAQPRRSRPSARRSHGATTVAIRTRGGGISSKGSPLWGNGLPVSGAPSLSSLYKNLGIWILIGVVIFVLFNLVNTRPYQSSQLAFSDFLAAVQAHKVAEVTIRGEEVQGTYDDGKPFQTFVPDYPDLVPTLTGAGVRVRAESPNQGGLALAILNSWLPMLLIIGVWIFFMRQAQGGGNRALSFGKIRSRQYNEKTNPITFEDVAGIDESKEELKEIVEFLRDAQKFQALGGQIPRGVLLMGAPGTGKTLLAKAIAGEAGVPFFSISGSDFVEMFVGVGASRVRDLFEQGKKNAPCIIFIDEIDAVGRHRGTGLGGGHDEREQTLNQLLVEMDGFEPNEGIILIAATNRPDVLDPALLRPGRFDRHVVIPLPDIRGREAILKVHCKPITLAPEVDLSVLAKGTPGFAGADLANLVNEAALWAARQNKAAVSQEDFEYAKDKVMMGTERRSVLIPEQEKKVTAFHEAGHALIAELLPEVDPVHKVTIIPRGQALGLTQLLPEDDRHSMSRGKLLGQISMMLGGRAAEQLTFNQFTTGAANDIQQATQLARRMVMQWGMSPEMGPVAYTEGLEPVFLGRDLTQHNRFSQRTAKRIDNEVRGVIAGAYERTLRLLRTHQRALIALAHELIERETVEGAEVRRILQAHRPEAATA